MIANQYRIGELAEKAGVTKRTIHYYMGRGLLPPSEGEGLGTTYSEEHLYRIMLIKKLQEAYLPLDEIKKKVIVLSLEQVKEKLDKEISSLTVLEKPADYVSTRKVGSTYERLDVGLGVEIHFPSGNRKAGQLAEKLYKYADKLLREG